MPENGVYDTRFFVDYFYSTDPGLLEKMKKNLTTTKDKTVSTITIHEVYRISLEREGRDVAKLRSETMRKSFKLADVDYLTAITAAEIRHRHHMPLADSIIAATAKLEGSQIISDDPHFQGIADVKTRWL
jgi:predicted nucleic acid-binding protein